MASFKEAFAAARKAQGAGGTFTWKGDSYNTNIVGEKGTKEKTSSDTDAVKKADDKAPMAGPSFKEAFAAARKAQGAGGTFTWKGDSYNTNIVGEKGKKKAPSFSIDMAKKAINDASTPRPQKRPADMTPKPVAASKLPVYGPSIKVSAATSAPTPAKTDDAKVSVNRSPNTDNSMGGRLGRALGNFAVRLLSGPSKMDKMKAEATDQTNRSTANRGMLESMTGRKGAAAQYKSGGLVTKSGSTRPCKTF